MILHKHTEKSHLRYALCIGYRAMPIMLLLTHMNCNMQKRCLMDMQVENVQVRLYKCAVLPEPLLFAQALYSSRRCPQTKR